MKLVTFEAAGAERFGALVSAGDRQVVLDLAEAFALRERRDHAREVLGDSLLGLIERGEPALAAARELVSLAEADRLPAAPAERTALWPIDAVRLLAPIPRPPSMRDGYAFRQHVLTARRNRGLDMIPEFDQFPVFYFTNHQAVTGPGEVRVQRLHLDRLDFELEVAMVVGRRGRNVKASEGDAFIAGLTIMNDWSARHLQMEEMKLSLGPAKGKDFATSLGPWLVTLDELEARRIPGANGSTWDLAMTATVGGVQVSAGNLKDMTWTFAQILERASYGVTLHPGDVIGSGTVGTGCFLELNGSGITKNQWLAPGDVVTLAVEGLGELTNRIALDPEG